MKEIIFKTENKAYRWKPTKWMKAVKFGFQVVLVGFMVYTAMFMVGVMEMGM